MSGKPEELELDCKQMRLISGITRGRNEKLNFDKISLNRGIFMSQKPDKNSLDAHCW